MFKPKSIPHSISANGKLLSLDVCKVMGIINTTPDSFYAESRNFLLEKAQKEILQMIKDGVDIIDIGGMSTRPKSLYSCSFDNIIDIGGMSTRPKSLPISEDEEWERIKDILVWCRKEFPQLFISIDTYRSEIAKKAIAAGADIINDISAGTLDPAMISLISECQLPYIVMHMQGTPENMQDNPQYNEVALDILDYFIQQKIKLNAAGVHHIIIDPGFGFGKTLEQNYALLHHLNDFQILDLPILVGLSRKGMIWKTLNTNPAEALYGTIAAQTIAILKGANIVRVHDVKAAKDAIKIIHQFEISKPN